MENMKKLLFIYNPKAGKGQIKTWLLDIIDIFTKQAIRSNGKADPVCGGGG